MQLSSMPRLTPTAILALAAVPRTRRATFTTTPPLLGGPNHIFRKPSFISSEHWDALSYRRQLALSHVGHIEETDDGETAAVPCERCKASNTPCMVYRREQVPHASPTCSRCRYNTVPCSHRSKGATGRPKSVPSVRPNGTRRFDKYVWVVRERKAIQEENEALKGEVQRLRAENERLRAEERAGGVSESAR